MCQCGDLMCLEYTEGPYVKTFDKYLLSQIKCYLVACKNKTKTISNKKKYALYQTKSLRLLSEYRKLTLNPLIVPEDS